MSEISNLWFKLGFGIVSLIFVALNFLSYIKESSKYLESLNGPIRFSAGGYSWGFPFRMYFNSYGYPNYVGFEAMPTALNFIIALVCAGAVGIFLEFVRDKFRSDDMSASD